MRRVRMLGLGLVAVLAICVVGASPALAKNKGELSGEWEVYKACPLNPNTPAGEMVKQIDETGEYYGHPVEETFLGVPMDCFVGETESGYFKVGKVTTPLSKSVHLQGVFVVLADGQLMILPTEPGYKTLESPELPVPGGIARLKGHTAGWPEALRKKFKEAVHHGEGGLTATIEVAGGSRIYETEGTLSTENLLFEEGSAFILPLKVRLKGPFLTKLQNGEETCHIGSESDPPVQHLTTGLSISPFNKKRLRGGAGKLHFNEEFTNITLEGSSLVDNTWEVPTTAEECGGEYSANVEQSLNEVLELPAPAGKSKTVLSGTLHTGNYRAVRENYEEESHEES